MATISALNGAIPRHLLAVIDAAGHLLRPDAAASMERMRAAGAPIGVVTSAYRSKGEQKRLYDAYRAGGGTAAAPGTSQHGEGLAVDFPEPGRAWVRRHGAPHGWRFPIAAEPWHGEYDPRRDTKPVAPAPVPTPAPNPAPAPPEEDPMLLVYNQAGNGALILADGSWTPVYTAASATALRAAGVAEAHLDDGTYAGLTVPSRQRRA